LPRYAQIRADLLEAMEAGTLKPGDRAPSERELTERYGVSRMTARHALDTLQASGYLTRVPGSGTFVSQPKFEQRLSVVTSFTEEAHLRGMVPDTRVLSTALIQADAHMAERMHLRPDSPIIQFQRLRLVSGTPMALETSNLPLGRFPGLESVNLGHDSLYRILLERYGFKPAHAVQSIEVMAAGTFEAGLLSVKPGAPLLLLERFTRDGGDQIVEYVRSFYRGDKYRFVTDLKRNA
jgi:GntR family transcriptional regulator